MEQKKESIWTKDISQHIVLTLAAFGLVVSAGFATLTVAAAGVHVQLALAGVSVSQQSAAVVNGLPDDYGTGSAATGVYCPQLSTTLQKGSRDASTGGQVSELQNFLTDYYNLDENVVVGGFFGNVTQKYVIQFQTEQGLPNFGIVGSLTRAAIASVCGNVAAGATVRADVQPANTLLSQASAVRFTTFTLTAGAQSFKLNSIVVQRMGLASDAVFKDVLLTVNEQRGTAYATLDSNHQAVITLSDPILVPAHTTLHFVVSGDTSLNLSQDNGKTVGLSVVAVNTSTSLSGSLPITGATHTVSSSASTAVGALTFANDASSPSYQVVAGGTTGVTVGVFKLRASGDNTNIQKIGLTLTQGKASDLGQVYLYAPTGALLGTATFVGNSNSAVSTLSSGLGFAKDTEMSITIKADIANVGVNQPGTSGDLITIYPDASKTAGTGVQSGATIVATSAGYKDIPGVRIFKSYPTLSAVSLPSTGANDGRLLRFAITANQSGMIGLSKLSFTLSTVGATVTSPTLAFYSDASFSQPIGQSVQQYTNAGSASLSGGGGFSVFFNTPVEVFAGQTYYVELRGSVSSTGANPTISTSLQGDTQYINLAALSNSVWLSGGQFIWSPNDLTTSQSSDSDWTDGYGISGLGSLGGGISQTRTGTSVTTTTTCPTGTVLSGTQCVAVASTPTPPPTSAMNAACPTNYLSQGVCSLSRIVGVHAVSGLTANFFSFVRPDLTYAINFGDGTEVQAPKCTIPNSGQPNSCNDAGYISHTYAKAGTYTVQVLNYACVSSTCSVLIDVTPVTVTN